MSSSGCVSSCRDEAARTFWFVSDNANGTCDEGGGGASSPQCVGCGEGYFDTDLYGNPACVSKAFMHTALGLLLTVQCLHLLHIGFVLSLRYWKIARLKLSAVRADGDTTSNMLSILLRPAGHRQQQKGGGAMRLRLLGTCISLVMTLISMVCPIRKIGGWGSLDEGLYWSLVFLGVWLSCLTAYISGMLWIGALPRSLLFKSPRMLQLQKVATEKWHLYLGSSTLFWGSGCVVLGFKPGSTTFWLLMLGTVPFIMAVVGGLSAACSSMLTLLDTTSSNRGGRNSVVTLTARPAETKTEESEPGGGGTKMHRSLTSGASFSELKRNISTSIRAPHLAAAAAATPPPTSPTANAASRKRVRMECSFVRAYAIFCGAGVIFMSGFFSIEPIKSWGRARPIVNVLPCILFCALWEVMAFTFVMRSSLLRSEGGKSKGAGGAGGGGVRGAAAAAAGGGYGRNVRWSVARSGEDEPTLPALGERESQRTPPVRTTTMTTTKLAKTISSTLAEDLRLIDAYAEEDEESESGVSEAMDQGEDLEPVIRVSTSIAVAGQKGGDGPMEAGSSSLPHCHVKTKLDGESRARVKSWGSRPQVLPAESEEEDGN